MTFATTAFSFLQRPIIYHRTSLPWLGALLAAEAILHLTLIWKVDSLNLWSASCLFWGAAIAMLWRHRHNLQFRTTPAALISGGLVLLWLLFKSQHIYGAVDIILRLSPLLSVWAWSTIATGFHRHPITTRALQIVLFLAMPWGLLYLLDLPQWTATTASSLLTLIGYPVHQSGLTLSLPHVALEVYQGCSGAKVIVQLLSFTWIYLCWFAPKTWMRFTAVTAACALGFGINVLRVALMAVLANGASFDWLAYWHFGEGSLLFSLWASGLYCTFLWFMTQRFGDRPKSRQTNHPEHLHHPSQFA